MQRQLRRLCVIILAVLLLAAGGCGSAQTSSKTSTNTKQSKLVVVAGTSLIGEIVKAVGGNHVDVSNAIPAGACPGHYDLKPADLAKLGRAKLFIEHDWQAQMFNKKTIDSVNNPKLVVVPLSIGGNWMAPDVQKLAAEKIAEVLEQKDSANKELYAKNLSSYLATVASESRKLRSTLDKAGVSKINVACSDQQADFLKWAGYKVVITYGRPDALTPKVVENVINTSKEQGVKLLVDNLQSGPDAGKEMAKEIGAAQVTISNFPGAMDGTGDWPSSVEKNVELLLAAI